MGLRSVNPSAFDEARKSSYAVHLGIEVQLVRAPPSQGGPLSPEKIQSYFSCPKYRELAK